MVSIYELFEERSLYLLHDRLIWSVILGRSSPGWGSAGILALAISKIDRNQEPKRWALSLDLTCLTNVS